MKAYLPYVYMFDFIPPKRVRSVYGYGAGTVEVDVPEISLSETGLAASLEYVVDRPQQKIVVLPAEYRTWNGSLLSRVGDECVPTFKASWLPTAPDGRSRMPSAKPLYGFVMGEGELVEQRLFGHERVVIHRDPPKGNIIWSHEDRDREIVKRLAGDLVSVDGELWRKTRYAALCLDMRHREGRPLWSHFAQEPFGYLPFARNTVDQRQVTQVRKLFDVSQADRLVHHAGSLGVDRNFRSLVVHDHDALAFDGEREFIKDSMDFTVLTTENSVGEMSASAIVAWSAVRSAVERVSKTDEDFTDGEIEAFRLLATEYTGEKSDLVRESLGWCEDYLNDKWGRYGSRRDATPGVPKAGM
ncbi:hypothetical protein [Rhizobium sp. BK176]|uniref:hypothetical protein n=1 Tax=Rhizobium sp. BK176 TaxID=2587071 RepID=UPI0021672833|nr:hypothetical protein [Rhizobium sp. BK176]MCS4090195.1 hypothetical protein [Rhizobium sp. BK176]